jgi:hypothetical protein
MRLKKLAQMNYSATRAKQNPKQFPTVAFYIFPVVMTWLDKENEKMPMPMATFSSTSNKTSPNGTIIETKRRQWSFVPQHAESKKEGSEQLGRESLQSPAPRKPYRRRPKGRIPIKVWICQDHSS